MKKFAYVLVVLAVSVVILGGCATTPGGGFAVNFNLFMDSHYGGWLYPPVCVPDRWVPGYWLYGFPGRWIPPQFVRGYCW